MTRWHPYPPSAFARRRVGLLGGSFNPAHEGHRYIARAAVERLGLDEVWWLVSPQNPLKKSAGMAPPAERFAAAMRQADHPRMRVTDIEGALGTTYTAETLRRLVRLYPHTQFVWLMGADNMIQIPAWKDWSHIFHTVPVAVFARPDYSPRALSGVASGRFFGRRRPERDLRLLAGLKPPAWVFVHSRLIATSATAIRARRRAATSGSGQG
jgi:nicotinate-nucleotide adenylyltransferase